MKPIKKFFVPKLHKGKAGTGRWFIYYYQPGENGKAQRIKVYGNLNRIKDIGDRQIKALQLMDDIARRYGSSSSPSVLIEMNEKYRVRFRLKTYQTNRSIITTFHTWLKTHADRYVTPKQAYDFLTHLKSSGRSNTTVHNYKLRLCALYNKWKRAEGSNANNPFSNIESMKGKARSLMYFTPEQTERIKRYCIENDPQLWLAIRLLFYCFIRPGELRLLKVGDISITYNFIELCSDISKNRKTEKVTIPVQMLPPLTEVVQTNNSYYIFGKQGRPGSIPLSTNDLSNRHRKVLKELNIHGRYALYSWKHTGVVMAVKSGINLKDLQLQLRHHSLDMVNEYMKDLGVTDSEALRNNFPTL